MKRILHFLFGIPKSSGVANVIMNYYRHIDRSKIQFDFFIMKRHDDSFENEIETLGGKVFYSSKPKIRQLIKFRTDIKYFFEHNASKYIAVQLHDLYLNSIVFPLAKKYGIKHCIAHSHTTMYSDKLISKIRNYLLFLPLKKNASIYFACSEAVAKFTYGEKTFDKGKVKIINNAINSKCFEFKKDVRDKIRAELNIEDKFIVGHIGLFTPVKNHKYIIEVFQELLKYNSNAVLMLIGSGKLYDTIRIQSMEMGIYDKVRFMGLRRDINQLLQAMDVFIFPSYREGLPLSVVEAQASGLKCFVSDTVTNEVNICNTQFLNITSDPKEWAIAINSVDVDYLRNSCSEEIIRKRFDIVEESKKIEQYYMNL